MRFENVVAVVSGASGGIGEAICAGFRREGARVVGLDVRESRAANLSLNCDLIDERDVAAAATAVSKKRWTPTVLVHAAAVCEPGGTLETSADEFLRAYDVNVVGAVRLAQAFVPGMKRAGRGAIVFISSINSQFATPTLSAYSASKGALDNLTRTLALELAPAGIRVNAIRPASVDTPMLRDGLRRQLDPDKARRLNVRRHPLARLGTPRDVANLSLFLCSDDASWMTGSLVPLDGGAGITRR